MDDTRTYTRAVTDDWIAGQDPLTRVAMATNAAVAVGDRVVDAAVHLQVPAGPGR